MTANKILFTVILTVGLLISIIIMANDQDKQWQKYTSREPRVLRVELAAAYDQVVEASGQETFSELSYTSNDNSEGFSMTPWEEPEKSAVIIRYGLPEPIFELPPSTFVTASFEAAHMARLMVKPVLEPLKREETLALAKALIEKLNSAPLQKVPQDNLTLDEVKLRMQLLAKDMDETNFQVGQWRRKELHGSADFALMITVVDDEAITDPSEQLYSLDFMIDDFSGSLDKKLEELRLKAREIVKLKDGDKPCTQDSYDCDIPDVRLYLDALRKEKLIPLQ